MNPSLLRLNRCALLAWLAFLSAPSSAATTIYYWTGGSAGSGRWSAGANWLGGAAPSGGDQRLVFQAGAARKLNTNDLPAGTTFESVWFNEAGYNVHGNSVRTTLVRFENGTGTATFRPDITAAGDLTLHAENAAASLIIAGDVVLSGDDILFPAGAAGDVTLGGVVSGSGNIYKYGSGDVSLAGLGANTFSGTTYVLGGILRLSRYTLGPGFQFPGTTAVPGNLVVGGFTSGLVGDIVVLERDNQIADTATVSVLSTGSLELSNTDDLVGTLRLFGGTVSTGEGLLQVDGDIHAGAPVGLEKGSSISGRLSLGGRGTGSQVFNVEQGESLRVTAAVSGVTTAHLIKTNRGELWLAASNTFAGNVEILGGTVTISMGSALGDTNGVTRLQAGTLALNGTFGIGEHLAVPGPAARLEVVTGNPAWLGPVRLDDDLTMVVPTNSFLTLVGRLSGPAGWLKLGQGTLQFKTTETNSYAGTGEVRQGDLILDGVFHQPVISGPLVIGTGNPTPGTERVSLIKANQIADTRPVTIHASGLLTLGGWDDTVGPLTLNGGGVDTGGGLLTLNGDILARATNQAASIAGRLALGGVTRTIDVLGSNSFPDLAVTASIIDGGGTGGLRKTGEGMLQLSGSNSFSGPLLVTGGVLRVTSPHALGSPAGGTMVAGGTARLVLDGGVTFAGETLTLNGTPGAQVLESRSAANRWDGPVVLLGAESRLLVFTPGSLAISGPVSGGGGLAKFGPGSMIIDGDATNSYLGTTFVGEGDLILNRSGAYEPIQGGLTIGDGLGGANADRVRVVSGNQIANGSRVVIHGSGQLVQTGVNELVGSIEGAGNILLLGLSAGLVVGRNDLSTAFAGVISGTGAFEKVGLGTLTLTGASTYTGATGVDEGVLQVDGSIAPSSLLFANFGVTLPGRRGIVAGNGLVPRLLIQPGGMVSPGAGPGRLRSTSNAVFNAGILRLELNGPVAGVSHDQLRVTSGIELNHAVLDLTVGFTPALGDSFTVVDQGGTAPVQGTFAGIPQGGLVGAGAFAFRVNYTGGTGNDIVLTRVATPPATITSIKPAGDSLSIAGQGLPGMAYVLEFAPHVLPPIPWTPLATNAAAGSGLIEFVDGLLEQGQPLHPVRFYRVRSP